MTIYIYDNGREYDLNEVLYIESDLPRDDVLSALTVYGKLTAYPPGDDCGGRVVGITENIEWLDDQNRVVPNAENTKLIDVLSDMKHRNDWASFLSQCPETVQRLMNSIKDP